MNLKSRAAITLTIVLGALVGCAPKPTQESLVGYWSFDEKSAQNIAAALDPKKDGMGAQMALLFVKMAASGMAFEFTGTELRQIMNGDPSPARPYQVSSIDGARVTVAVGKESFTYTFLGRDSMETTLPDGKSTIRINRLNAAAVDALKKKMELVANGPAAGSPLDQRFNWLLAAPAEKAASYLAKHPGLSLEKNERDETLLHLAARSGNKELAKRLVEAGAERNSKDKEGRTPFQSSLDFRFDPELSKLLYTPSIDLNLPDRRQSTLLEDALRKPDLEKAEFLCELGADPDEAKAAGQKTLFLLAVEKGDLPVAKLLLKHGANINHRVFNSEQSALHVAAQYGSLETLRFLLEQGMPATTPNKDKNTAISYVHFRQDDKIEAVRLLVQAGADINERPSFGGTLLCDAIKKMDNEFAKALIEAGADFETQFGRGPNLIDKSAYETAKDYKNTELVSFIETRRTSAPKNQ